MLRRRAHRFRLLNFMKRFDSSFSWKVKSNATVTGQIISEGRRWKKTFAFAALYFISGIILACGWSAQKSGFATGNETMLAVGTAVMLLGAIMMLFTLSLDQERFHGDLK